MVRLSKKLVTKEVFSYINDLLLAHIARIGDSRRSSKLLNELISPAERIQLAKRFAIVALLEKGHSTSEIEKFLKVSRTTIGVIEEKIERGSYDQTLAEINRAHKGDLWAAIEHFLHAGMPPMGKNRWQYLNKEMRRVYPTKKLTKVKKRKRTKASN